MAEQRTNPPQDHRTNLQKEIDRQQVYDEAKKAWDAQQKAMKEFEDNLLFGLALKGLAPEVPFIPESQKAYELMQRLFEIQHQKSQLEKEDQSGQGSPMRSPKPERNSRYGNRVPLATPGSSAGDWLRLQQSDFGARLPQGVLGRRSDLGQFDTPVTNPLVGMGLLRSPFDFNQAQLPLPAVSASQPSPASGVPHWLAALASHAGLA
jgi:hypothetical protein